MIEVGFGSSVAHLCALLAIDLQTRSGYNGLPNVQNLIPVHTLIRHCLARELRLHLVGERKECDTTVIQDVHYQTSYQPEYFSNVNRDTHS